jgi:hypothetical protein
MTREEAYIEMIKGNKITNKAYCGDDYYCFADKSFRNRIVFRYKSISSGRVEDLDSAMILADGYSIYDESLTFERIKKECISMKHFLIDQNGGKRMYLGFTRPGLLVTDQRDGAGTSCWTEFEIKNWKIEAVEK